MRWVPLKVTLVSFLLTCTLAQTQQQPSQIESPNPSPTAQQATEFTAPTLKINVRNVLVDVVVTDKDGNAVPGLHKEDFQITENGKAQTIEYFEPHFVTSALVNAAARPLPPNTFTNVHAVPPNEVVNVLLMDALNTQTTDQLNVRLQMVKYLDQVPPGVRVAVFLLNQNLRIVQGFTDDPAVLHAALKRYAPNASSSVLLASPASTAPQAASISMISAADTASALDDFMKNEANFETNMRLLVTLDSLQTIARYLSGVPGRKNLIWFVGSFPLCAPIGTSVTSSGGCPFQDKVEKTVNMLAEARVSIYPIDAGGVSTPDIYKAETPNSGTGFLSQTEALRSENTTRGFQSINSATWAEKTGGKAYHTNDIKGEMSEAIDNGSRYYTLAYAPHSPEGLGRERKIEVRVPSGNYKLSYRRNYFELNRKELKEAGEAPAKDPLRPLMDRGMPSFTQLRYQLKVEPVTPQPPAGAAPAGDNPALKGPSTRYRLTFALEPGGLTLTPGPDGVRRGNIEVALIAYSQPGASLNWQLRSVGLAIRPEQMAIAENTGIPLRFDFDVPNGDVYLRTGIYDAESSRAGTLEIPLNAVKPPQAVAVKQVAGEHDAQAHLPPHEHSAVRALTVQQLEQLVNQLHDRSDKEAAQKIAECKLTERLSTARLDRLETYLPGEHSRSALQAIANVSAFLPVPDVNLASAPMPDAAAQKTILSRAVDFVLATTAKMPDFLAQKRTSRFQDMKSATYENEPVVSTPDFYHLIDNNIVTVRYRDGQEEDLDSSNARKQKLAVQSEMGLTTQGIFGPMLQTVMHDILNGKIGWSHWEQSRSGPVAVFRYSVPREHATFTVTWCCVDAGPGIFRKLQKVPKYHGEISVDPESGAITRLLLIADLEPDQLVSTADLFVEFSPIEIGGRTYVCPTRTGTLLVAKSIIEHGRQVKSGQTYLHATEEKLNITSISDSRFDQYHVFRSEMKIVGQ